MLASVREARHIGEMSCGEMRASERLRLIPGGQPDKLKRQPREESPWECRTCEADIGVRTRALIKVRLGAMEDAQLRISGGRDVWCCASCLARGKVTQQTA